MRFTSSMLLLLLFLLPVSVSAQHKNIMHNAPAIMDKENGILEKYNPPALSPADGNYFGIDTLTNALSFAESGITPLCFDPYSGLLALVHRGWSNHYALTSGHIWENISTDYGVSWKRVPGGVNTANTQLLARYPNMSISNPTKGKISATTAFFVWPEINPITVGFGWMGYAAEQPVGSGNTAAFLDQGGDYSTKMMAWADDQTPEIFWVTEFQSTAGLELFKTADFATIQTVFPPQWNDAVFQSNGNIGLGGCAYNGIQYVGVFGPFDTTLVPNPPPGGWLVGYSKSTDKGATWSTFKMADWRKIPRLSQYESLFDYKKNDAYISYQGSIGVDKNNHVHLVFSVSDTALSAFGVNSIIDLFETSTGWDGNIVYKGLDTAYTNGPGFGQVGPGAELAFDSTHSIMAVQFINTPAAGKPNDVFLTYKALADTAWAVPINLTNSDQVNNTSAHIAPYLSSLGNNKYTAFSAYCYGLAPFDPNYDGNSTGVIYGEPYTFTYTPITPVELTSFKAGITNGIAILNWKTATEKNNMGFDIERKFENKDWLKIGYVNGKGTTLESTYYQYSDNLKNLSPKGIVSYRLRQVDFNGTYSYSEQINLTSNVAPATYSISQNYPNPFNPSTKIDYDLPFDSKVTLEVYNITGEMLGQLVNDDLSAGYHSVDFHTSSIRKNLGSGIYFYRIIAANKFNGTIFTDVKKMILLK